MLLMMDGFDHYGAQDSQRKGWSQTFGAMSPGRFGSGQGAKWQAFGTNQANRIPLVQNSNTLIFVGFGWQFQSQVAEAPVFQVFDGGVVQVTLTWDGNAGLFKLRQGDGLSGMVLGTSAAQTLTLADWHYIDFALTLDATNGAFHLNVDSVADVIAVSGVGTVQSTLPRVTHLGLPGSAAAGGSCMMWYDDMYCFDSSGSDSNVAVGDVRISFQPANADGYHHDFLPAIPGNQFQNVNAPILNTSSFVSDNVVGHSDTFLVKPVGAGNSIKGVQVILAASKDDAAPRQINTIVRSGGSDTLGNNVPLTGSVQFLKQLQPHDPSTSALWTVPGLNAAEFGVKIAL